MKLLDRLCAWKTAFFHKQRKQKEQTQELMPPGAILLSDADLARLYGGAEAPFLRRRRVLRS
jgi:hypothetical protein